MTNHKISPKRICVEWGGLRVEGGDGPGDGPGDADGHRMVREVDVASPYARRKCGGFPGGQFLAMELSLEKDI